MTQSYAIFYSWFFGFAETFITMIQDITARFLVNGILSDPMPVIGRSGNIGANTQIKVRTGEEILSFCG